MIEWNIVLQPLQATRFFLSIGIESGSAEQKKMSEGKHFLEFVSDLINY